MLLAGREINFASRRQDLSCQEAATGQWLAWMQGLSKSRQHHD